MLEALVMVPPIAWIVVTSVLLDCGARRCSVPVNLPRSALSAALAGVFVATLSSIVDPVWMRSTTGEGGA